MADITFNPQLTSLVLAIVAFTWFVFLDVCSRLTERNSNLTRGFWLIGPLFLGFPLWSIYFITRLSVNIPILINQHWLLILLTVAIATLICLLACVVTVLFSQKLWAQLTSSVTIALLFSFMHFITLGIENNALSFNRSGDFIIILLLGALASFVLLRAAIFLKHSNYIKHIFSTSVITMLAAVMYVLEMPKLLLLYTNEINVHSTPLFDNVSFGYAIGLTAFTLLISLMAGIWFSRAHTLTSKPTKTLRISLMIIAIGSVSIVTTSRWLIEHTLGQDIVAMYLLDSVEHDVTLLSSTIQISHAVPSDLPYQLKNAVKNIQWLISGRENHGGEAISPLRDRHMVSDLNTLLALISALDPLVNKDALTATDTIEKLTSLNAIIDDVQYDIHIAINNDRQMLTWTNFSVSFILIMMFVVFSWLISRSWYGIEAKNKQLKKLVKRRTEELEKVLSNLDTQISELASNNAKISLLNEALGELRDNDHLYDEGEFNEFYAIVLENIIRVVNASFVFYARYQKDGRIDSQYTYGIATLKEEVSELLFSATPCKLNEMLYKEKVSIKIDNMCTDRITKNDLNNTGKLRCFLGVPVIVSKKVTGTVGFFNKEDGSFYSDDDEILMNIFASHLAHVIERHSLLKP